MHFIALLLALDGICNSLIVVLNFRPLVIGDQSGISTIRWRTRRVLFTFLLTSAHSRLTECLVHWRGYLLYQLAGRESSSLFHSSRKCGLGSRLNTSIINSYCFIWLDGGTIIGLEFYNSWNEGNNAVIQWNIQYWALQTIRKSEKYITSLNRAVHLYLKNVQRYVFILSPSTQTKPIKI